MLSRLIRYATAAAVPVIPNNSNKFLPLRRFISSSAVVRKSDFVPSYDMIESCKCWIGAVDLFESLLFQGGCYPISHYNFILSSLLEMGCHQDVISLGQKLEEHCHMWSHDPNNFYARVVPDIHTWSMLITGHCILGNMYSAISLFENIINSGHQPCTETLNDIFDGFYRIGDMHAAIFFYNEIVLKKGFQLNHSSYNILIKGLCEIGETKTAIHLLRHALQIDSIFDCCLYLPFMYNSIIFRLCKDRLVNQAYDLYSEMIHVSNIKPDYDTYHHLIYGYCILGQFKQAIALFREFRIYNRRGTNIYVDPTLVNEGEVKSAKSAVAVMIKGGVKPSIASYHSVVDGLYKGGSRSLSKKKKGGSRRVMNNIAQKMEALLLPPESTLGRPCYD